MPAASNPLIAKLKVHLRMSIQRLRMVQQKDEALAKQQRRAMASLLETHKYESARIRVENIIRSDLTTELHEILELYCELLLARAGLLEPAALDPGLEEAVVSLVHAAPRTEIKELQTVRALLIEKYGRDFAARCADDKEGKVPERVRRKLRVEPPEKTLVESYLEEIAAAYGVPYGDKVEEDAGGEDDGDPGDGGQKETVGAGGGPKGHEAREKDLEPPLTAASLKEMSPPPKEPAGARSPVSIAPPSPRTDNANPRVKLPGPPDLKPSKKMQAAAAPKANGESKADVKKPEGEVPDVNDLEKRFAMLKR